MTLPRLKAEQIKLCRHACHMLPQGARVTCYPGARVSHVTPGRPYHTGEAKMLIGRRYLFLRARHKAVHSESQVRSGHACPLVISVSQRYDLDASVQAGGVEGDFLVLWQRSVRNGHGPVAVETPFLVELRIFQHEVHDVLAECFSASRETVPGTAACSALP